LIRLLINHEVHVLPINLPASYQYLECYLGS